MSATQLQSPRAPSPNAADARYGWLPALRLLWYLGAVLMVALTEVSGIAMPALPLAAVLGLGLASVPPLRRLLAGGTAPAAADRAVAAALGLDVALLTVALLLTGGAYNPFSLLYLVLVVVAVQATRGVLAWTLTGWTVLAFAALFLIEGRPLAVPPQTHDEHVAFHLRGMWLASGVAAAFIAAFVGWQRRVLDRQAAALAAEREARARAERLASLATLAAGAAHELATPLGTIGLVAAELGGALAAADPDLAEVRADVELIGDEVQRCRAVLDRMAAEAGQVRGEAAQPVTAAALVAAVRARLRADAALAADIGPDLPALALPLGSVATAVAGLCDNALRAAAEAKAPPPTLALSPHAAGWEVTVSDQGAGIAPATLARVGEPFFTTRATGDGMGLGVFLAREVADRLGGSLRLDSAPGRGTRATLVLPGWRTPAEVP